MAQDGKKPNGAKAGWKFLRSRTHFENEIFRLREDDVELEDGKQITYAYLERDEAVVIVPITKAGEMVMLKQYRYAVDDWCLEIPAGGTHDAQDASLEEVVRKELREEVGATAEKLTYVNYFFPANATMDEKCHVFLAEGVELSKKPNEEETETIQTQLVPVAKAIELARSGEVKTGPCALAILLCEPHLQRLQRPAQTPDHQLET
ncbi:MAG TPA: NUDIX hydrolase [Chthoniobacterales bacterium]|nr:NUDIX hydrolase [Chthoniobacterales bacterium]